MATTTAQLLANRENAQHSTGPTSPQGKAKSSLNNLQHGLAARGFIVLPGQESAFHDIEQGLTTNLQPHGALQQALFTRILECTWNLHRCRLAQAELYQCAANLSLDPLLDDSLAIKSERIQKYAKASENSLHKNLRELSRLQTEHQFRDEAYPLTQAQLDDNAQLARSPHALSEVCQYEKVDAAITRRELALIEIKKGNKNASDPSEMLAMFERLSAPPKLIPEQRPSRERLFQSEANRPDPAGAGEGDDDLMDAA